MGVEVGDYGEGGDANEWMSSGEGVMWARVRL